MKCTVRPLHNLTRGYASVDASLNGSNPSLSTSATGRRKKHEEVRSSARLSSRFDLERPSRSSRVGSNHDLDKSDRSSRVGSKYGLDESDRSSYDLDKSNYSYESEVERSMKFRMDYSERSYDHDDPSDEQHRKNQQHPRRATQRSRVRSSMPDISRSSESNKSSSSASLNKSYTVNSNSKNKNKKRLPIEPKLALHKTLLHLNLPRGLLTSATAAYNTCDSRLWILDNSSAMQENDAHLIGGSLDEIRKVSGGAVSRWNELQECVAFHAMYARRCWVPTRFILVNDPSDPSSDERLPQKFSLCWGDPSDVSSEMNNVERVMKQVAPEHLLCPLTSQIKKLTKVITREAPTLKSLGKHTNVVICTQGLPSDKEGNTDWKVLTEFERALKALSKLPVKITVRLCTDVEKVREMYNALDADLNDCDVLDDYWGEAMEVYLHNPWLTYGIGLHRLRECGLAPQIMDFLDERPFTLQDIHEFCSVLLIGEKTSAELPHPRNWSAFKRALNTLLEKEKPQWSPIKKKLMPWIDLEKLEKKYGELKEQGKQPDTQHSTFYQPKRTSQPYSFVPEQPRQSTDENPTATQSRRSSNEGPKPQQRRHTDSDFTRASVDPPQEHGYSNSQSYNHQQRRHTNFDSPHEQGCPDSPSGRHHWSCSNSPKSVNNEGLSLEQVLQRWSHQPPGYDTYYPLEHLLFSAPNTLFPPANTKVEAHEYFNKWKAFDKEAFDEDGEELKELLKRAARKAKFFLHPDKLPKDLTENQTLLFKTMWEVIQDRESARKKQ